MEKLFVCLAVSFKYGGRCIGGVEVIQSSNGSSSFTVVKQNGIPQWVRPVTRYSEHGEIPMNVSSSCHVGDIVKLTDVEACPDCAQSENYYFTGIEKVGHIAINSNNLNMLCDESHSLLFGNKGKAVHPDCYREIGYSLMLIKAKDVDFFMENRWGSERKRLRVSFSYNGIVYDLPVTDPDFCETANSGVEKLNGYKSYYLTISLGVEFEGWHSKLVANVIPMN